MPLHPMVFACLMGVTIDSCSNIIAQRLKAWSESKPFAFDRVLFIQFVFLSVIAGPLNYNWQVWLERTFPGWKTVEGDIELQPIDAEKGLTLKEDGVDKRVVLNEVSVRNWVNVFKKWFLDCMTMGALLNQSLFLLYMGIVKGKTFALIEKDFKNELFGLIWDSYKIWPIANFISTTYCPVERRIIFLSACGLIWNIYLSLVAARL